MNLLFLKSMQQESSLGFCFTFVIFMLFPVQSYLLTPGYHSSAQMVFNLLKIHNGESNNFWYHELGNNKLNFFNLFKNLKEYHND